MRSPDSVEGAIAENRFLAQQYEARVLVIERGGVPLGFGSMSEFQAFGWETRSALARSGNADAEPYLRGSAVTGYNYRTGAAFDVGRVSDYDLAVVSPRLLARAVELGVQTRGRGSRTEPLDEPQMRELGLWETISQIRRKTGRAHSNFVVHRDTESLRDRGPNLKLP